MRHNEKQAELLCRSNDRLEKLIERMFLRMDAVDEKQVSLFGMLETLSSMQAEREQAARDHELRVKTRELWGGEIKMGIRALIAHATSTKAAKDASLFGALESMIHDGTRFDKLLALLDDEERDRFINALKSRDEVRVIEVVRAMVTRDETRLRAVLDLLTPTEIAAVQAALKE